MVLRPKNWQEHQIWQEQSGKQVQQINAKSSKSSGKSSGKLSKSSNNGHDLSSGGGNYDYDINYAHYSKSSKSGKSGDANASKYDEALMLEDDDVYILRDGSGDNEHDSSGDVESSEDGLGNIYDNLANDSSADDGTFNDVLTQNAFRIEVLQ